jgi:hypothetical protein
MRVRARKSERERASERERGKKEKGNEKSTKRGERGSAFCEADAPIPGRKQRQGTREKRSRIVV